MASGNELERNCFAFIWKIENASYFWQKPMEYFPSPSFVVHEIEGTKWRLDLYPSYISNALEVNTIAFCLVRLFDSKGAEETGIEWQVALLASDGTVLSSCDRKRGNFRRGCLVSEDIIPADRIDVLVKRRSEFLPQDTLTVCCKIWKRVGEMSKDIKWVVRSSLGVKKRSFLWQVGNFSALESEKNYIYEIKSLQTDEQLMSLNLFLTRRLNSEEIHFAIIPKDPNIKFCPFELSAVDAFGNVVECLKDEFWFDEPGERKQFSVCLSKAKLMEKSNFLSLRCACCLPSGKISETISFELCFCRENEIKRAIADASFFENSETKNRSLDRENVSPRLKNVLNDDFKSMLNEGILSDIKLRASSKTYPAHKCILSARSPVFKAMFTNDMKEKVKDCIDIEDLNGDTVFRMLHYIYCAEVEELEWDSATQLYEASDKYEILVLRDVCSSFLKNNLCQDNACEALMLADLHEDEDMKGFVQDFILKHGDRIIYSEEWEKLMKANLKLAADTMRLKFKCSTHK